MKVYLVILEDRHRDVAVDVFADLGAAVTRAEEIYMKYAYFDGEAGGELLPDGWHFLGILSSEGDKVRVQEAEVQ